MDRISRRGTVGLTGGFVALGDSLTVGIGDGATMGSRYLPGPDAGWAARLAPCLGLDLTNLATTGAMVADVAGDQLQTALVLRPSVASVVVGLNDALRTGWDEELVRERLLRTVSTLADTGAEVLTLAPHDPTRVFPWMPQSVATRLSSRCAVLRDIVLGIDLPGVTVVDASAIEGVHELDSWDVDRAHPSPRGHALVAAAFAQQLATAGVPVLRRPDVPEHRAAGTLAHGRWVLTTGVPWLLRRRRVLVAR